VIDFPSSGRASAVNRKTGLPLASSVVIHAAALLLVLGLVRSDGIVERRTPPRVMILLAPPPVIHTVIHVVPYAAHRTEPIPPRLFRAPASRTLAAPLRELTAIPALQIPLFQVARPLLPAVEVARLAVAPPPPLGTDNFALSTIRDAARNNHALATVRSSGFEQTAVDTPPRLGPPPRSSGGFEDATVIPTGQARRAVKAPALAVTRSVEILSKPRPAYTEEARRMRIEGEVLLDILFAAAGQVRVLETVRGLGHGLDESAIAAAETIRFRPAERAGIATESTAIVHIVFQIAF
jgi:TonB family protein